jgi:hypothetical protein
MNFYSVNTSIRTTTCFLGTMHIVSLDNNGSGISHIYIIYDNFCITNIKYIKCKVQDKVSAFLQQLGQLDLYNKPSHPVGGHFTHMLTTLV